MSFSRYDYLDIASSRPAPEPEVRHAIMAKWALAERRRRQKARTCCATSGGHLQ
jgi:hypothetical protein